MRWSSPLAVAMREKGKVLRASRAALVAALAPLIDFKVTGMSERLAA